MENAITALVPHDRLEFFRQEADRIFIDDNGTELAQSQAELEMVPVFLT